MNVGVEALLDLVARLLRAAGTPPATADVVARHLVEADLCGYATHGVATLPSYLDDVAAGRIVLHAQPAILQHGPGYMRAEGRSAFGHFAMDWLVRRVLDHVSEHPVCFATMRGAGHIGRLGGYVETLAEQGCVALLSTGVALDRRESAVAPFGSMVPCLGTNPIAVAAPTAGGPFVFDAGTGAATVFGVLDAARRSLPVPPGVLLDAGGNPTRRPGDLFAGGAILPFGGHKGFGLSLATCLLGALSGDCDPQEGPVGGVALLAIKVDGVLPGGDYPGGIARFLSEIRATPPLLGAQVRIPGDRAREERERRRAEGIPVTPETWRLLVDSAVRLGIPIEAPAPLAEER